MISNKYIMEVYSITNQIILIDIINISILWKNSPPAEDGFTMLYNWNSLTTSPSSIVFCYQQFNIISAGFVLLRF